MEFQVVIPVLISFAISAGGASCIAEYAIRAAVYLRRQ